MAVLTALMRKGANMVPGQIKFNSTTYPAPYGYASFPCAINDEVFVDGIPSDPNLTAPNDPRTVQVASTVQYTTFYYA
jgi:hypothetical protein